MSSTDAQPLTHRDPASPDPGPEAAPRREPSAPAAAQAQAHAPAPQTAPSMLVALLDGRLVPPTLPLIRPDDLGVLRGDGVFETVLIVDGVPRDLDAHLRRMSVSAAALQIELPADTAWRTGIAAVSAAWAGGREQVVRLVATRGPEHGPGPTCYVTGAGMQEATLRARRDGIRVVLLDRGFAGSAVAQAPWLLPGAKTLSYAINMAAQRYAAALGEDDVIFVGSDGLILEGPTATVVIARGRTLLTPARDGILEGITVHRLFAAAAHNGWQTVAAPLTPQDLHTADGLFLVSSVRLVAPVVSLHGTARSNGSLPEELARLLQVPRD